MSADKRPRPNIPTLHALANDLDGFGQIEPAGPESPHRAEAARQLAEQAEEDEGDVATALAHEAAQRPKVKRKKPKTNSGSVADPYPLADGTTFKVKTALNFTEDFAREFHLFAAEYLRLSSKSAWAERVLAREIQRTRKRAGQKPSG